MNSSRNPRRGAFIEFVRGQEVYRLSVGYALRRLAFLKRRLSVERDYGLYFTLGIAASAILFAVFLKLALEIAEQEGVVRLDHYVLALAVHSRTPGLGQIMLFFTHFGSGAVVIASGIVAVFIAFLTNRVRTALFLVGATAGSQLLYGIFKLAVHRARPDAAFAWVPTGGYSFPSGHTASATIFYGALAFFLWRSARSRWEKGAVFISISALIFVVGVSRVYLGAHWLSDVIAGWIFGVAFLAALVSVFNEKERIATEKNRKPLVKKGLLHAAVLALLLGLAIFITGYALVHPLKI